MGSVRSVNIGKVAATGRYRTGIDKRPVTGPVHLRAPGGPTGAGSGVVGDEIGSARHHGGDDQAVYAYAAEDLDGWAAELGRPLPDGTFGENLTTVGIDVSGALAGERWRVGTALLQACCPRIPCATFQRRMGLAGWVARFTAAGLPGTYLRVVEPGDVTAGDAVEVVDRPDHDVTISLCFRALTTEKWQLPRLAAAGDALPASVLRASLAAES